MRLEECEGLPRGGTWAHGATAGHPIDQFKYTTMLIFVNQKQVLIFVRPRRPRAFEHGLVSREKTVLRSGE